jgi:seryl-tRNA synthetase
MSASSQVVSGPLRTSKTAEGSRPASPAESVNELVQLRETIVAMREEMERINFEKQRGVQEAVSASNVDNQQLRSTVQALREEMEHMKRRFEEELQAVRTTEREEQKQLHEVILTLREQLERA